MEVRFSRSEISTETKISSSAAAASVRMQRKLSHNTTTSTRQKSDNQQVIPDLTDFMNDMFFGTVNNITDHKKSYNLSGNSNHNDHSTKEDLMDDSFESSTRSRHSKLTQDWLEEARLMVAASSPSRGCDTPSRLVGSPRFAAAQGRSQASTFLERRDPLSRSARRHRSVESFSGEILSKSAKHTRNNSETTVSSTTTSDEQPSHASAIQKWFSNILKPSNPTPSISPKSPPESNPNISDPTALILPPPRQSLPRKSRFQTDPSTPRSIPSGPNFKDPSRLRDTHLLSPPKNLIESAQRRSISSSTCSVKKIEPKCNANGFLKSGNGEKDHSLNGFLKEQRSKIEKILNGDIDARAKVVLSEPSNSTSSMVAAMCYAWLLENRTRKNNGEGVEEEYVVVPVMNVKRERMWKLQQAAWLFYHVGLDATSLLFADEVDLESLMMVGRLNIIVIGQDVLKTNGKVGSQCSILTDNYCEDAYDLLQTHLLKKLLLAGILLDTKNLNASTQSSMTRDAEAVQLLLVGLTPNYRNELYDQLIQDQRDSTFSEDLQHSYGKPPKKETSGGNGSRTQAQQVSEIKPISTFNNEGSVQNLDKKSNDSRTAKTKKDSPKPAKSSVQPMQQATSTTAAKGTPDSSRGKNKFLLAKWFGFGSK